MNYDRITKGYMLTVVLAGSACLALAAVGLPLGRFDVQLLVLLCLTIGLGSRISVQIPRFKSHISVSDTFIFLALLLYGGQVAIILSVIEAVISSRRFCSRNLTIAFNGAAFAISTSCVVLVLRTLGLDTEGQLHGHEGRFSDFVIALSAIALTQFFVNTVLASVHDSLKDAIPYWETWKSKYLWVFPTYFIGAAGAGALVQLSDNVGIGVALAVFPVILLIYLTYKMYLRNVEMSIAQAETAVEYANALEERTIALRESEERFRSAFNYAPIGIALVTASGKWQKVNHALCEILGFDSDEFLERDFQSMIHPEDLEITQSKINALLSGQISNCQLEKRYVNKSGHTVWASWSVSADRDTKAENVNLIFQIQDITGRKLAEQKLQYEATHDALTGLPNRAYFMTRLTEALQKLKRDDSHNVSVLFIDLDRFKYVNDSLGHYVGDHLLVAISKRLHECMRPSDTVARLGGDEFTILVEGDHALSEVTRIAERVQQKFGLPFQVKGHEIYSSASIGILHASDAHLTSEDMMRDADTAMYQAKRSGKARHEVFNREMYTAAKETLRLETDLRRAVEGNEFTVLYQPIFSLQTGEVYGIEALARWHHFELGEILPSKFVPLAEEIGWIDQLGDQIMTIACNEINGIFEQSNNKNDIKLSVNFSSRQFVNADMVERVVRILDNTGFPPNRLKLEITESVFFEYQDRALEMLNRLRALGIETDIDDFGTGYSNLGYLVRLPISTLKIDRSFVGMMLENPANREVIRTVISLARNLGLKVVAEGIETEAQREALNYLGCDFGQGYLFAKPMPAEELRSWFTQIHSPSFSGTLDTASSIETVQ
jgi:diguanylate cyclase (GGDEF)-like protein/PAS domain S-box-containing protein